MLELEKRFSIPVEKRFFARIISDLLSSFSMKSPARPSHVSHKFSHFHRLKSSHDASGH